MTGDKTPMEISDLEPCPFCGASQGGGGVVMNQDEFWTGEVGTVDCWYVDCIECGASAGSASTEAGAAAAWNRRANK